MFKSASMRDMKTCMWPAPLQSCAWSFCGSIQSTVAHADVAAPPTQCPLGVAALTKGHLGTGCQDIADL
jgi:hypothetical protein